MIPYGVLGNQPRLLSTRRSPFARLPSSPYCCRSILCRMWECRSSSCSLDTALGPSNIGDISSSLDLTVNRENHLSRGVDGSIHGIVVDILSALQLTDNPSRYGTIYLFLQLVPPFSMLFLLTAAVSSALWAADHEAARRALDDGHVAPQYSDEPDAIV